MSENKPAILLIEDDPQSGGSLCREIAIAGDYKFQVFWAKTVQAALDLAKTFPALRLIVCDVMLDTYSPFSADETDEGKVAGLKLISEFAEMLPQAKIFVKTQMLTDRVVNFTRRFKSVIRTASHVDPYEIARRAEQIYNNSGPEILIMHGHDTATLREFQHLIQNRLRLGNPKILRELPNDGRTIIEKLEYYARRTDLVFCLLTDDDPPGDDVASEPKRRARQNVIFETGYFVGAFGRKSGRVIILKKGDIDIPSDLGGVIQIDVTKGVEAAGEEIRNNLSGWWGALEK